MVNDLTRRDFLKIGALLPFGAELIAQCLKPVAHGRFALSAIGWIEEPSARLSITPRSGNRLRWLYPSGTPSAVSGPPLGIPDRFIVERADLGSNLEDFFTPKPSVGRRPTMFAPNRAWVNLSPLAAGTLSFDLPTSAQALYFEYSGEPCEVLVEDTEGASLTRYALRPNSQFYVELPDIRRVRFSSARNTATKIKFLDLYNDAWLNDSSWHPIAEIDVKATVKAASLLLSGGNPVLPGLSWRLADSGSLDPETVEAWKSTLEAYNYTSGGGSDLPQGISYWDILSLATQSTWKMSVLSGFGYIDGSRASQIYSRDHEPPGVQYLNAPSQQSLAYRVRTEDPHQRSNYVVVDPGRAPDLEAPIPFSSEGFVVRPTMVNANTDGTNVLPLNPSSQTPELQAIGQIKWTQRNYWETGLALSIKQMTQASGDDGVPIRYTPAIFSGLDRVGQANLEFEVSGGDWRIDFSGRSFDGWDRLSTASSAHAMPNLDFQPPPPVLGEGYFDAKNMTVKLSKDPTSDWKLDKFSTTHTPYVFVWQRTGTPSSAEVTITNVVPQGGGSYQITLSETVDADRFADGQITANPISAQIDSITGKVLTVLFVKEISGCGDTVVHAGPQVFQAGPATVIQSASHRSLWVSTGKDWPLEQGTGGSLVLAKDVTVPNQTSPLEHAEVALFAARVELRDVQVPHPPLEGPFSNTVPVLKLPLPPPDPGRFKIEAAGVDYYGRTIIEISLIEFEDGILEVLWSLSAEAWRSTTWSPAGRLPHAAFHPDRQQIEFGKESKRGVIGRQAAFEGNLLYDVLPIDYYNKDVWITIGVRRLNEAGVASDFSFGEYLAVSP